MKPSIYNVFFYFNDKLYVYNTLSSAILTLTPDIVSCLKAGNLKSIDNGIETILKRNGIIVDMDCDEYSVYEYYYNSVQYNTATEELRIVILPTYQCNLCCSYCFEDCKNLSCRLTDEKIVSIIRFIENEVNTPRRMYKRIGMVLFGGEPLVCKKECLLLTERIKSVAEKHSLEFVSKIITNATLIDENVVKQLILPYKMRIQITLDGNQQTHDERRKYKSGHGSFDKIQKAIQLLNEYGCKELIDLRLNIDKGNLDCVESVFCDFHDLCGYMYIGLLRPSGNNACHSDACITDNDYLIKIRPMLKPIYKKYKKELHYVPFGKKRPCALNRPGSFIIDPELYVYKCDNLVGMEQFSVGRIVDGNLIKSAQYYSQLTWSPFHSEKCRTCKLLPVCASDCAYRCFSYAGSMFKPYCAMTEQQLIEKVKIYIAERNGSDD
nr:SPASM domain-containing protein [Prevotella sp.]